VFKEPYFSGDFTGSLKIEYASRLFVETAGRYKEKGEGAMANQNTLYRGSCCLRLDDNENKGRRIFSDI